MAKIWKVPNTADFGLPKHKPEPLSIPALYSLFKRIGNRYVRVSTASYPSVSLATVVFRERLALAMLTYKIRPIGEVSPDRVQGITRF